MKCSYCQSIDNMASQMYLDKNNNLLTESELSAFEILHPEAKGITFQKITLCGICYGKLSNQSNLSVKSIPTTSTSVKTQASTSSYYICAFCNTPNEHLRNTCKKCARILFSTEYETKRVPKASQNHKKTTFKYFSTLIAILLIAIYYLNRNDSQVVHNSIVDPLVERMTINQQSTYVWPDGTIYTGDFKNGRPHGKGTLQWADGNTYNGEFLEGEMTGQGQLNWSNGAVYVGTLVAGKPHGEGKMTYPDGSTYSGVWVNGEAQ